MPPVPCSYFLPHHEDRHQPPSHLPKASSYSRLDPEATHKSAFFLLFCQESQQAGALATQPFSQQVTRPAAKRKLFLKQLIKLFVLCSDLKLKLRISYRPWEVLMEPRSNRRLLHLLHIRFHTLRALQTARCSPSCGFTPQNAHHSGCYILNTGSITQAFFWAHFACSVFCYRSSPSLQLSQLMLILEKKYKCRYTMQRVYLHSWDTFL